MRELELYQQAGFTNAEALQTATIIPARMTGMDDRTGLIAPGKTADIIVVDGDVSKILLTCATSTLSSSTTSGSMVRRCDKQAA